MVSNSCRFRKKGVGCLGVGSEVAEIAEYIQAGLVRSREPILLGSGQDLGSYRTY